MCYVLCLKYYIALYHRLNHTICNLGAKVQKKSHICKHMREIFVFFLLLYYFVYLFFQEPTSFSAHRSVITYLLSSVVSFRAFLFAGVPCVPSVAKILQRVVAFLVFKILHRIGGVLYLEFLYQLGKVLYLPDYRTDTIVSLPINSGQKDLLHSGTHAGDQGSLAPPLLRPNALQLSFVLSHVPIPN